jgi:hypothetical protein
MALTLLLVVSSSCKGRPAGPVTDAVGPQDAPGSPGDPLAVEEPADAQPAVSSDERCMSSFLHGEADRREAERKLVPVYLKAKRHSIFMDLIEACSADAAEGRFDLARTHALDMAKGTVGEQDMSLIDNVLKMRLTAFASCMSLASKSDSWCVGVGKAWSESSLECYKNYTIFVLIAGEVIAGKKSCADVMKKLKVYEDEVKMPFCEALSRSKPELCPGEELSFGNVMCQSAASRGTTNICKKGNFADTFDRDYHCCELLGWRFANVVDGTADGYVIPELGALSGDAKGCGRALTWGLVGDLGPVFDLEVPAPPGGAAVNLYSHYICPLSITWSMEEPP